MNTLSPLASVALTAGALMGASRSMNSQPHHSLLNSIIAMAAGWVVVITVLATEFFVVRHDEHFAPEIGPLATYLVFSAALTAVHILNFLIVSALRYFGVFVASGKPLLSAFRGAIAYVVLTSIGLLIFSTRNFADLLLSAAHLAVSGAVSFYTLSRLRHAESEDVSRE